ncbi:MAG: PAS domain S-box protein [Candidatus Magnetoovum sp. WYHC-5]|nr:PAS domain S-box protein [Candidatus Magnetoovum sp. WYHC-5]
MKDELKSKKQLIEELNKLRKQVTNLTQGKEHEVIQSVDSLEVSRDLFIKGCPAVIIKWLHQNTWLIHYVSSNITQFGYTASDLIAQHCSYVDLVYEDDLNRVVSQLKYLKVTKADSLKQSFRMKCKDGQLRWITNYINVVCGVDGNVIGYNGYILDITEQKNLEDALIKSEERLKTLISSTENIIIMYDTQGRHLYCNAPAHYGIKSGTIIGKKPYDFFDTDTADSIMNNITDVINTGKSKTIEQQIKLSDQTLWFLVHMAPAFDYEGDVIAVTSYLLNITERKKAEVSLNESEERFRIMADTAPVIIWIADENSVFNFLNKQALEFFGKSLKDIIDAGIDSLVHDDERTLFTDMLQKAYIEHITYRVEVRYKRYDGEYRWFLNTGVPRFDKSGLFVGFIGSAIDITDRKNIEKQLLESRERLKLAQKMGKIGYWEYSLQDKIHYWSEQLFRLFERNINLGHPSLTQSLSYYNKEDADKLRDLFHKATFDGLISETDVSIKLPSARHVYHHCLISPVRDNSGNIVKVIGINQEITERKLYEERNVLALKQQELLISEMHHWVKNILQVILGLFILQSRYTEESVYFSLFKESENRVKSISLVIENIKYEGEKARVDMNTYVKRLCAVLTDSYNKSIEINLNVMDILLDIYKAIPCGLIINEVVSNAFKHAFGDSTTGYISINFVYDKTAQIYTLDISDNGVGLPQVFDIHSSDTMGFKLLSVLVEQLECDMTVISENGTSFTFLFRE